MAFRKPIIVSSCPPLRRVVEQSGCGFVFRAGDPFSLAEILVKARGMRAGLPVMGEKGESAALTRYSWDRDKRTLLDLYDRMLVRGNAETTVGRP
jgi:glycosyltransferase involved in cell wall biosynthesis